MRPPRRPIEPARRGVSMPTRGEAASAASRVAIWPASGPLAGRRRRLARRAGRAPAPAAPRASAAARLRAAAGFRAAAAVAAASASAAAAPSAAGRKKSASRSAQPPTARWRAACSFGRSSHPFGSRRPCRPAADPLRRRSAAGSLQPPQRVLKILGQAIELPMQGIAASDQHVIMT